MAKDNTDQAFSRVLAPLVDEIINIIYKQSDLAVSQSVGKSRVGRTWSVGSRRVQRWNERLFRHNLWSGEEEKWSRSFDRSSLDSFFQSSFLFRFGDDCYEILQAENKLSYSKQLGPSCILRIMMTFHNGSQL